MGCIQHLMPLKSVASVQLNRTMRRCLDLQRWITAWAYLQLLDQRNLILAWRPAFALLTSTSLLHVLCPAKLLARRPLIGLCSISLLQARLVIAKRKSPSQTRPLTRLPGASCSKREHQMGRLADRVMTLNSLLQ